MSDAPTAMAVTEFIVRELVDGTTGQRPGDANVAPGDSAWWEEYRRRVEQAAKDAGSGA